MSKKYVFPVLCVILGLLMVWLMIPKNEKETGVTIVPDLKFSLSIEKEDIISLIAEKGVNERFARILTEKIPEKINAFCVVEYTGENNSPLRVKSIQINGYEVPRAILNDISENYLDFNCSLVYN